MDQESNAMEQHPVQCRNGCGFYAGAGTEGFCSVCYKDVIKKKQQPPTGMPASLVPTPNSMASLSIDAAPSSPLMSTASPTITLLPSGEKDEEEPSEASSASPSTSSGAAASNGGGSAEGDEDQKEGGKKKKSRCLSCKKKVGLTGFTCRCGGLFCPSHRYSDKHACNFDYKELGQKEIRKSNPVVVAKKVQQI